jgi:serine/threonine protein kinase
MANDVFISYASKTTDAAALVQQALSAAGIHCWKPSAADVANASQSGTIHGMIDTSRVFVLVHSTAADDLENIARQARRAAARGLQIVVLQTENAMLSGALAEAIGPATTIAAFDPPAISDHLEKIVQTIRSLLDQHAAANGASARPVTPTLATVDTPPEAEELLGFAKHPTPNVISSFSDGINDLRASQSVEPPSRPGLIGRIDHFELIRKLGEGGMGVVLLAKDTRTDQTIALKTVKPEYSNNARVQHRFVAEANHMQRMNHPHVLKVLETKERPNGSYYVMAYMPTGSLANRIRPDEPMPVDAILRYGKHIADALRYAHDEAGVIHRDIKPENVLIDAADNAYLSDFGLVRTVFNDTVMDNQHVSWTVGTRPYMAPEIVEGKAGDTRADIYSFGAMLYEMATGRPPYSGDSPEEVMTKIKLGPPPRVSEMNPNLPRPLAKVIEGAMGRELRQRYAHMADMLADLERVENGLTPLGPHDNASRNNSMLSTDNAEVAAINTRRALSGIVKTLVALVMLTLIVAALLQISGIFGGQGKINADQTASNQVSKPPANLTSPTPAALPTTKPAETAAAVAIPNPTPAVTVSPTPSATPTPTAISTPTATPAPTVAPSPTVAPTPTPTPAEIPSPTPAPVATSTPNPIATATPAEPATPTTPAVSSGNPNPISTANQTVAMAPTPALPLGSPADDLKSLQSTIDNLDQSDFDNLVESGRIDVNGRLPGGDTPIQYAVKKGREAQAMAVKLIGQKDAKLNLIDHDSGDTLLDMAAAHDLPDVINELKKHNVDIDAPHRDNNQTALYLAVFNRQPKSINALLDCGADPDFKVAPNPSPREQANTELGEPGVDDRVRAALQKVANAPAKAN